MYAGARGLLPDNRIFELYRNRTKLHNSKFHSVFFNVPWTVDHDINFEAITNLMHKYLQSYNITIPYMFRALLCSSSGSSIVYV